MAAAASPVLFFEDCPAPQSLELGPNETTVEYSWRARAVTSTGLVVLDVVSEHRLPAGLHVLEQVAQDPLTGTEATCTVSLTVARSARLAVTCPAGSVRVESDMTSATSGILATTVLIRQQPVCTLVFAGETPPDDDGSSGGSLCVIAVNSSPGAAFVALEQQPETLLLGRSSVVVLVRDTLNNETLPCELEVTVVDALGPSIVCPSSVVELAETPGLRDTAATLAFRASDPESGISALEIFALPTPSTKLFARVFRASPMISISEALTASYHISAAAVQHTFQALDPKGNARQCSFRVHVRATQRALELERIEAAWTNGSLAPGAAVQQLQDQVAAQPPELTPTELNILADVVSALLAEARRNDYANLDLSSIFVLLDRMLGASRAAFATAERTAHGASRLRAAIAGFAADVSRLSPRIDEVRRVRFTGTNMVLEAAVVEAADGEARFETDAGTLVRMPAENLAVCADNQGLVSVAFVEFAHDRAHVANYTIATRIVQADMPLCDTSAGRFPRRFIIELPLNGSSSTVTTGGGALVPPQCAFFQEEAAAADFWSRTGVSVLGLGSSAQTAAAVLRCDTTHLTAFAGVDLTSQTSTQDPGDAITVVLIVVLFIAAILVGITLLVHLCLAKLRFTAMSQMVMNLCFAILCAFVILLFSMLVEGRERPCRGFAVFVHYFLLAAAMWLLCDAVFLRRLVVQLVDPAEMSSIARYFVAAWSAPIPFVVGVMIAGMDLYAGQHYCWIQNTLALILAFFLPLALIILATAVLLLVIFRATMRHFAQSSSFAVTANDMTVHAAHTRAALVLFFVLCAAWIAGAVLDADKAPEAGQMVLAGLILVLGICVFVFYVILDPRVWASSADADDVDEEQELPSKLSRNPRVGVTGMRHETSFTNLETHSNVDDMTPRFTGATEEEHQRSYAPMVAGNKFKVRKTEDRTRANDVVEISTPPGRRWREGSGGSSPKPPPASPARLVTLGPSPLSSRTDDLQRRESKAPLIPEKERRSSTEKVPPEPESESVAIKAWPSSPTSAQETMRRPSRPRGAIADDSFDDISFTGASSTQHQPPSPQDESDFMMDYQRDYNGLPPSSMGEGYMDMDVDDDEPVAMTQYSGADSLSMPGYDFVPMPDEPTYATVPMPGEEQPIYGMVPMPDLPAYEDPRFDPVPFDPPARNPTRAGSIVYETVPGVSEEAPAVRAAPPSDLYSRVTPRSVRESIRAAPADVVYTTVAVSAPSSNVVRGSREQTEYAEVRVDRVPEEDTSSSLADDDDEDTAI